MPVVPSVGVGDVADWLQKNPAVQFADPATLFAQ
jgi:hypothetical protein